MSRRLKMSVNLNVLEHLGMNLYSNVPAVLSEIVANSWDADASVVDISLDMTSNEITIQDDGIGMTRDQAIDHFLTIGYRRRFEQRTTERGRRPMGRKGIGKLASFSIAQIVSVYTCHSGKRTTFRMDADKIKENIAEDDNGSYYPEEIHELPGDLPPSGTRIVLSGLKRQLSPGAMTKGLRQRLARRFSIIGKQYDFCVKVDGVEIGAADRGYQRHIEFLWTYGDMASAIGDFSNLAEGGAPQDRTAHINRRASENGLHMSGWIGTVRRPGFLKTDDGDNLNRIAIFMRGKLAQEDILADFGQKDIYADYVVGEIYCDNLDSDDEEDIATSSRQSLKFDDPRFEEMRKVILSELRYISTQWNELRRKEGTAVARREVPEVAAWLDELPDATKRKAEHWIGRLNRIRSDGDREKRELLKASILAFESYRRKEQLDLLEKIADRSLEEVLGIFKDIDDLQFSYYGQIVNLRLGVINTLKNKLDKDEKEKVIQDHIYNHLWLLDPSWERVKGSETIESRITNWLKGSKVKLTSDQMKSRIDIGYRTASGRHVIVELKRASVKIPVDELSAQIRKYRDGARELIAKSAYPSWPLEIVCLVGEAPPEWNWADDGEDVRATLATVDARLVFYDQLLDHSYRAYADYLEAHKKIDRLWKIFQAIENFADESVGKDA